MAAPPARWPAVRPADAPTLPEIRRARARLAGHVRETPVWRPHTDALDRALGGALPVLKLELFQHGGSFKPRGALCVMLDLDDAARARGVTALSAGNHAIAVAYAARALGTTATVVIPRTASPVRVARCRALGATVVLVETIAEAFDRVREIEAAEGRTFVHPFEGPRTALGTATLGDELLDQAPELDAVIVPIGGGGLAAGIAAAVKQRRPEVRVYGVEPTGADTMHRSLLAGEPQAIDAVRTIADSLGAPHAAPYSFALCRAFLDDLVLVEDEAICRAMALLFDEAKLVTEPAAAAATAAACGPLRERLAGKTVGLIVCGSNIDADTFHRYVSRGLEGGAGA